MHHLVLSVENTVVEKDDEVPVLTDLHYRARDSQANRQIKLTDQQGHIVINLNKNTT